MPEWVDAWAMAKRSDDPTLLLVTITHPNFETVRLVNNTEDFVSRGETYKASWFEVDWVNDDGEMPRCSLSVPNVVPAEIGQRYLGQVVVPEASGNRRGDRARRNRSGASRASNCVGSALTLSW